MLPPMPRPEMADVGFHQGVVLDWDQQAGTNRVEVNGVPLDNLPVAAMGSVMIGVGDVVALWRYHNAYFVMGRIAPINQALTVRAAEVPDSSFVTSTSVYSDLNTTVGPTLTDVYIGPSRRCLVFLSCGASSTDMGYASAHFQVTGASAIDPPTGAGNWSKGAYIGSEAPGVTVDPTQVGASATRIFLLTEADGLNTGLNTFTVKYMGHPDSGALLNNDCFFFDRVLVVFPL